ncbi:neurofilament heavy polypeptide-like, partial [Homarus americanus]|uniref:neurofilament heavy polypeptide-like n=1 Tax=Homarus americanus TaxID=6706 RepID=UPI001C46CE6C
MKRVTEALKKASESDVPRFTSGSFIIGTPKPGLCDHVPLLGDILLARKIKIEMKRVTEALKKASESDVPRFTSGSFIIGTSPAEAEPQSPAVAELESPAEAEPGSQAAAEPESPNAAEPESPAAAEPDSPAEAEPKSPAAAELESPTTVEPESPAVAKQQSSQNQITRSVKIPKKFHGTFIGHKGAHIKQIGQKYGVLLKLNTYKNNISITTTAEPESPAAAEPGSPATAERESPAVAKQQSSQNQITKSVKIPKKFHGAFIGHKGAHIKQIGQKYGVLLGLNTNKNHPKPGLCDHVPLLGDILLARKIKIEMKRVTEALKKASESDVPRFTSGSFIIGTSPAEAEPGSQAAAEPESPNAAEPESPAAAEPDSPAEAEPKSPAAAELESPTTVEPESPAVAKQQSSQNQITRSVKIPKKFHGTFIGHKGAHIKQIGQKYGVLLKLNTYKNNISITTTAEPESPAAAEPGSPATAERESPAVAKQQSSQNQITKSVKIPKKFHGAFIGHKGAHIKQIGQKYGVLLGLNTNKNH